MVTTAKADEIIAEDKIISEELIWRVEPQVLFGGRRGSSRRGRRQRARRQGSDWDKFTLEADVSSLDTGENLKFRGNVGKTNRSFTLLYQNTPIRKFTVHGTHKDPVTRIVYTEPHKHWWDERHEDRRVYIPDDIRIGNPNEELVDFLKECNISLLVAYQPQVFPS